ncbi:MAG: dTDP-4-dehydrorhamnose reductase [Tannerella sp.]|jgi:dTDP-4-dehydrorhamnose reductase|nr:dTDP-4-dehydrorhamnose reductase [Tannerella sp.]
MTERFQKKNILVTGANGQLGNAIRTLAQDCGGATFHFTDVDTLDICDAGRLAGFVRARQIDWLLNCAAYTAVDRAEDDVEACMRINRDAVRTVGEVARAERIGVIHVSTDYVFDGCAAHPYREDDAPGPLSVYGQSKLAGEMALQQVCPEAVIIRAAWLYSEFGSNFVKTMLRLGSERKEINVVSDQTGTPTYAGDLAAMMLAIIACPTPVPGIYHYSGDGMCTWYDFAVRIMTLAGLDCQVRPIATQDWPARAARPAYSLLNKDKIKRTYQVTIPDWETSLRHCIQVLTHRHS